MPIALKGSEYKTEQEPPFRSRRVEPAHKRKGIKVTTTRVAPGPLWLAGRHPFAGGLLVRALDSTRSSCDI